MYYNVRHTSKCPPNALHVWTVMGCCGPSDKDVLLDSLLGHTISYCRQEGKKLIFDLKTPGFCHSIFFDHSNQGWKATFTAVGIETPLKIYRNLGLWLPGYHCHCGRCWGMAFLVRGAVGWYNLNAASKELWVSLSLDTGMCTPIFREVYVVFIGRMSCGRGRQHILRIESPLQKLNMQMSEYCSSST